MGVTRVVLPAALLITALPAGPSPAAPATCPISTGRFAVWGAGVIEGSKTPTARLMEERWLPNGRVEGLLVERLGSQERRSAYRGQRSIGSNCVAVIERQLPWGLDRSEVVLDGRGRPVYGLIRSTGRVISSSWLPMATGRCNNANLNGLVVSRQMGLSQVSGGWSPNAVVQREQWKNGSVEGIALSSYGGNSETASYSGQLTLNPRSCWGTIQETDQTGRSYNYSALIVNGRRSNGARGYLYLQRDPGDLTVGWLVRD
ncbi:hypothetical protein MY494_03275 [Synechococcus sp. A10-1-5-1]|uniref:hypothetical protein n=1 Tax=Synechococcus sp. A10-1-5-1 TaxID=2936507 RepID=UPI0020009052|nr:hypothetical protein [Synechococcus sp. A10-1-5-1]UPM50820.1 hypothetical protein MY494_03275 [Synechococcus sp. A10-1-5-1]